MEKMVRRTFLSAAVCLGLACALAGLAAADTVDLPDGSKLDVSLTCPVCNMKIAGGTPGPAAIVFKDGKVVGFDSAGDLFRYVLDPKKYGFDAEDIKAAFVTDAASKKFLDAKTGYFVLGSETPEGMPHDAVGFGDKDAAEKFKTENKGNKVAAYGEVTLDDLKPKKKLLKMDTGHGHSSGH